MCILTTSLRGRRLKGKGKGVLGARETRGARPSRFPRAQNPLSLPFLRPATQANLQLLDPARNLNDLSSDYYMCTYVKNRRNFSES